MSLITTIERLSTLNIVVVGDVMLDHYIWGDVFRISPEAPVPVVNVHEDTYVAGGAANVALNLSNLGVQTNIYSYFNDGDDAGKHLNGILSENKISPYKNQAKAEAATIIKTRILVRNQQLCRLDREDKKQTYKSNKESFDELGTLLSKANAVIISDYNKGVINQELYDFISNKSKSFPGLVLAVDPKPGNNINYNGATLLTPNRAEAFLLAGIEDDDFRSTDRLEAVCARIFEKYTPSKLVITLGADGMAICEDAVINEILPVNAREVFDVSGAGDAVISVLAAGLAAGCNLKEAAMLANVAAGCVVGHMGTAPIKLEELRDALQ